jgi:hypothetical protein
MLIVNRRCGTSEIIDLVYFDVEWERHIVANELKTGIGMEMFNVPLGTREQIIDA